MIDIKLLRENPDAVRASQKGRGEDESIVDRVLASDELRRIALSEFEALRAEQNLLSKAARRAWARHHSGECGQASEVQWRQ